VIGGGRGAVLEIIRASRDVSIEGEVVGAQGACGVSLVGVLECAVPEWLWVVKSGESEFLESV
jgi:hypothetical protein